MWSQMKVTQKNKLIKKLAEEFTSEISQLPITVLPNNDIVYEGFLIRNNRNGLWELYNLDNKDIISQFYLRTCALIAANLYSHTFFNEYREIKLLDRQYQRNYIDSILHQHSLKTTTDFDVKVIMLNRFECSKADADYYKNKISRLFKKYFV